MPRVPPCPRSAYDSFMADPRVVNGYVIGPGAILPGADLTEANLTSADMNGAILENADLTGAVLTHANLISAFLSNAIMMSSISICYCEVSTTREPAAPSLGHQKQEAR